MNKLMMEIDRDKKMVLVTDTNLSNKMTLISK